MVCRLLDMQGISAQVITKTRRSNMKFKSIVRITLGLLLAMSLTACGGGGGGGGGGSNPTGNNAEWDASNWDQANWQ